MARCFSFTAYPERIHRYSFSKAGPRSLSSNLGDGTIIHCWVRRISKPSKPSLLLLHGFGSNAKWHHGKHLLMITSHFNAHVPDLIFFGEFYTSRPGRTKSFQAQCVMRLG
ncbi:ALPHA/BETA-HYDROLASES SUPERFAMILY PROTEIN [Salix koriyanagi]|uniref:ALPHA/BETA-HYDROLASES SUPERFAMILY PROTEIN n=1 Tax=Salix koriyanagi TaxID=2511006 RepID=A0A9Q0PN32_9ROSI|nr:ALPHA/BETA-HYDROLASES SUPERFAMILY PROTEIN [Salix koriyanagi]